jgi:hypothetical protein
MTSFVFYDKLAVRFAYFKDLFLSSDKFAARFAELVDLFLFYYHFRITSSLQESHLSHILRINTE